MNILKDSAFVIPKADVPNKTTFKTNMSNTSLVFSEKQKGKFL